MTSRTAKVPVVGALVRLLAGAMLAIATNGAALAASDIVSAVQAELHAGRTMAAQTAAEKRLAEAPADDQARFALGAVQFLRAVERLGQGLFRHGLAHEDIDGLSGLAGLPILRLPVPQNPRPEPLTYEAFRAILEAFVGDLGTAEATLAGLNAQAVELPLHLGLIRLDLDGDGTGSDEEALWRIFRDVAGIAWLDETAALQLMTDFDASDVPWLRGYCHLLTAIAEFPLAHDWRSAFEATFHGLFPAAGLPSRALNDRPDAIRRAMAAPDAAERPDLMDAGNVLMLASVGDLVAFVHLNHWPVREPERLRGVLAHLEAVPRLSRENWRRILAETDDRNEWIPSPRQSGVLPAMTVTDEQVAGWMLFLDEFEALLAGKALIPHWRFDKGINLRRMLLEPRTFDLVLLIQGSAALPYLEDGPLTSSQTWQRIAVLFGGQFFRYAVWFN